MCVDENQKDTATPIIFPEWSLMLGTKLKRRDFRLDVMLKANDKPKKGQPSLFDIPEEIREFISINPVTNEYMAEPICEYPPVHFRKVQENGWNFFWQNLQKQDFAHAGRFVVLSKPI